MVRAARMCAESVMKTWAGSGAGGTNCAIAGGFCAATPAQMVKHSSAAQRGGRRADIQAPGSSRSVLQEEAPIVFQVALFHNSFTPGPLFNSFPRPILRQFPALLPPSAFGFPLTRLCPFLAFVGPSSFCSQALA